MQASVRRQGEAKKLYKKKAARPRRKLVRVSAVKQLALGIKQRRNSTRRRWPQEDGRTITSTEKVLEAFSDRLQSLYGAGARGAIWPDLLQAMARSVRDVEKREGRGANGGPLETERWEEVVANTIRGTKTWVGKADGGGSPASGVTSWKPCVKKSSVG